MTESIVVDTSLEALLDAGSAAAPTRTVRCHVR